MPDLIFTSRSGFVPGSVQPIRLYRPGYECRPGYESATNHSQVLSLVVAHSSATPSKQPENFRQSSFSFFYSRNTLELILWNWESVYAAVRLQTTTVTLISTQLTFTSTHCRPMASVHCTFECANPSAESTSDEAPQTKRRLVRGGNWLSSSLII